MRVAIIEDLNQRRLKVEGALIGAGVEEFRDACSKAREDLLGRDLLIELADVIAISQEAENLLLELINTGVRIRCCGKFAQYIVTELRRRRRTAA